MKPILDILLALAFPIAVSATGADATRAAENKENTATIDTIRECHENFSRLSFVEFITLLEERNHCSLDGLGGKSQFISQSTGGTFPSQLAHFLGHTLRQELQQIENLNGLAGLQEILFRFFSRQIDSIDRLESLKALLE